MHRNKEVPKEFDGIIALAPQELIYHINKGEALENIKLYKEALDEYYTAKQCGTDNSKFCFDKPSTVSNMELSETYISDCARALKLGDGKLEDRFRKIHRLNRNNHYDDALKECDLAIKYSPRESLWHSLRGNTLNKLERYGEAAEEYGLAIQLDPDEPYYHHSRAVNLACITNYGGALEESNIALQLDSEESLYHHERAVDLESLGRYKEALDEATLLITKYFTFYYLTKFIEISTQANMEKEGIHRIVEVLSKKQPVEIFFCNYMKSQIDRFAEVLEEDRMLSKIIDWYCHGGSIED